MKHKVKFTRSAQNQLLHENIIRNLISDLDTNQLTYLLMAVDSSHFEKIEREAAINKLLIDRFRKRLLQNKIVPPFEFIDRINIEGVSKEKFIMKAKEFEHTNKEIALMLLLQNHYEDALTYYRKSLEEAKTKKQNSDNEQALILMNERLVDENTYFKKQIQDLQSEIGERHTRSERTITSLNASIQDKDLHIQRLEREKTEAQKKISSLEDEVKNIRELETIEQKKDLKQVKKQTTSKEIKEEKLLELLEKVKELFPSEIRVVFDNIKLLSASLETIMVAITEKNSQQFEERTFGEIANMLHIAEEIHHYEIRLEQIQELLKLEDDQANSNEKVVEETAATVTKKSSESSVSTNENVMKFNLTEDIPEWNPIAFSINDDYKIEVLNWQDILIETCKLLLTINASQFMQLEQVDFTHYESENKNYISTNPDHLLNPVKIGALFVEATLSAQETRHVIRKMLQHYHLKSYRFKIYMIENN